MNQYSTQSLFEEEKMVPEAGLGRDPMPEDYAKSYKPSRNRVVIQYTDEQLEEVKKMLGLEEIKEIAYNFEDLKK